MNSILEAISRLVCGVHRCDLGFCAVGWISETAATWCVCAAVFVQIVESICSMYIFVSWISEKAGCCV